MIFKVKKVEPPYTQIHNHIIDNPNLSGKAKWILIYLLSKPHDWQVYERDISNHCTDGRHSIRSGVRELIDAGYIVRRKYRNEQGQFKGYQQEVHEIPVKSSTSTEMRFSDIGKPNSSNTNVTKDGKTKGKIIDWDEAQEEMLKRDTEEAGMRYSYKP